LQKQRQSDMTLTFALLVRISKPFRLGINSIHLLRSWTLASRRHGFRAIWPSRVRSCCRSPVHSSIRFHCEVVVFSASTAVLLAAPAYSTALALPPDPETILVFLDKLVDIRFALPSNSRSRVSAPARPQDCADSLRSNRKMPLRDHPMQVTNPKEEQLAEPSAGRLRRVEDVLSRV
jgi:hypothetical protein